MDIVLFTILFSSLIISALLCIWLTKRKYNKWTSLLGALIVNTVILLVATAFMYKLWPKIDDTQPGMFDSLGVLVFLFFIPVLTLMNYYIMEFVRKRGLEK